MKIVIGSAGRRVYLVRWFQEAICKAGLQGHVYVFENDENAASVAVADGFLPMPRYEDPQYRQALLAGIDTIRPDLFISLNDYELVHLADGLAEEIRARGTVVPSLGSDAHNVVADKLKMAEFLYENGVSSPRTVLLSDVEKVQEILEKSHHVIIKDRYGSGSSGLQLVARTELQRWINQYELEADYKLPIGEETTSKVVQPMIDGIEFGVDVVTPLWGGPVEAVLARKKLAMRGGETNVAESVAASRFEDLGVSVANLLRSQGLIDIDVIQTHTGERQVIDVNPRFGGGYPFSHAAGANVPSFYVAALAGLKIDDSWKNYRLGHKAAKYEETVVF